MGGGLQLITTYYNFLQVVTSLDKWICCKGSFRVLYDGWMIKPEPVLLERGAVGQVWTGLGQVGQGWICEYVVGGLFG